MHRSDVSLLIKLNWVKISLPFFLREQGVDNIFHEIELSGNSLLKFLQKAKPFPFTFYRLKK